MKRRAFGTFKIGIWAEWLLIKLNLFILVLVYVTALWKCKV